MYDDLARHNRNLTCYLIWCVQFDYCLRVELKDLALIPTCWRCVIQLRQTSNTVLRGTTLTTLRLDSSAQTLWARECLPARRRRWSTLTVPHIKHIISIGEVLTLMKWGSTIELLLCCQKRMHMIVLVRLRCGPAWANQRECEANSNARCDAS